MADADNKDEDEDEDEEEKEQGILEKSSFLQMTNIFGQSGSTAFRVRKDEKDVSNAMPLAKILIKFHNFFRNKKPVA